MKAFLTVYQYETLIGVVIFGVMQMLADILADLEWGWGAASARIVGIVALIALLIYSMFQRKKILSIPMLFTENEHREEARASLRAFVHQNRLVSVFRLIEKASPVNTDDLFIQMYSFGTPVRYDKDREHWERVARQMIREWYEEVDRPLKRWVQERYEGYVYHLCPHVVLPMAFLLGAAVGLRRRLVLYQLDQGGTRFHPAIDLSANVRSVLEPPPNPITPIQETQWNAPSSEGAKDYLILYFSIGRHPVKFEQHPNHQQAMNVGFYIEGSLPEGSDWLPYVQTLYQRAKDWVNQYQRVEVCLATPSTVAFALGMAFSRTPKIAVCHWFNTEYLPVLSLKLIEEKLPFD